MSHLDNGHLVGNEKLIIFFLFSFSLFILIKFSNLYSRIDSSHGGRFLSRLAMNIDLRNIPAAHRHGENE